MTDSSVSVRQLACADMVVVSKTDAMDGNSIDRLLAELGGRSRAGVTFVRSSSHGLDPEVLLGLGMAAEGDMAARHEIFHHHDDDDDGDDDHDAFESFAVTLGEIADPAELADRLAHTIRTHGILRLKGFAAAAGKPMRLVVQAVGPRVETYFDRPFGSDARETRLVVIGHAGLDTGAIATALGA